MHGLTVICIPAYLQRRPNMFGLNVSWKMLLVVLKDV